MINNFSKNKHNMKTQRKIKYVAVAVTTTILFSMLFLTTATNINTVKAIQYLPSLHIENDHGVHKGDYFYIIGQAINNSTESLNFVKITADLYDKDQKFIGTYYTYANQLQLGPNEQTAFKCIIGDTDVVTSVDDIAFYQLSIDAKRDTNIDFNKVNTTLGDFGLFVN